MSRTEFHGQDNADADVDMDVFLPKAIGLSRNKPLFLVALDTDRATVKITAAHTVTEVDEHHLEYLIESLQEVKDFLEAHPHRTSR